MDVIAARATGKTGEIHRRHNRMEEWALRERDGTGNSILTEERAAGAPTQRVYLRACVEAVLVIRIKDGQVEAAGGAVEIRRQTERLIWIVFLGKHALLFAHPHPVKLSGEIAGRAALRILLRTVRHRCRRPASGPVLRIVEYLQEVAALPLPIGPQDVRDENLPGMVGGRRGSSVLILSLATPPFPRSSHMVQIRKDLRLGLFALAKAVKVDGAGDRAHESGLRHPEVGLRHVGFDGGADALSAGTFQDQAGAPDGASSEEGHALRYLEMMVVKKMSKQNSTKKCFMLNFCA